LDKATRSDAQLAADLGSDYTITPDIVVARESEHDSVINKPELIVGDSATLMPGLRESNGGRSLLHASISCKWTIRSDWAQNARFEALNLIQNCKETLPNIMVITALHTPNRLTSISLNIGDIYCVYHFFLYEL